MAISLKPDVTKMSTECQPFPVPKDAGEPPTEFGRNLKRWMTTRNVSQTKLAEKTGLRIQTINGWLTKEMEGGPRLMEVRKVAEYLGASIDELAGKSAPTKGQADFSRLLSAKEERVLELYSDRGSDFRDIVDKLMKRYE